MIWRIDKKKKTEVKMIEKIEKKNYDRRKKGYFHFSQKYVP